MRIVIFTILLNFFLQSFEKKIKLYGRCHEKLKAFQLIETFMCDLLNLTYSQPVITSSKLTIEALEQGVKYVQS